LLVTKQQAKEDKQTSA